MPAFSRRKDIEMMSSDCKWTGRWVHNFRHLFYMRYKFKTCHLFVRINPDGVDIVLDCLCGEECNRGYSLLRPMGRYILYGNHFHTHNSLMLMNFNTNTNVLPSYFIAGSSNIVTGETKSFFSTARAVSTQFIIKYYQILTTMLLTRTIY